MASLKIRGTEYFVNERGSGQPLVLLHGFPLDSRVWEAQVQALSDQYRVIAPDLRGFGKTKSTGQFSMESLADDIHELKTQLGVRPCALAGLSMGGYVAQAYIKKYPTDFAALILVDTKPEADTTEAQHNREKMAADARSGGSKAVADQMMPKMLAPSAYVSRPQVVEKLRQIMESQDAESLAQACLAMRDREDFRSELASIAVPVLCIYGESDAITPPTVGQWIVSQVSHGRLAVIPGAGHMAPLEQPEAVTKAIRDFLGDCHSRRI
mgnify:CR=1 FL=1